MHHIVIIAVLISAAFASSGAQAHAMLERADPLVGSTVRTPPRQILLWFTEELEPAFSRIEVRDASGARVDGGKAQVDRSNKSLLRVSLRALSAGTYKVFWRVLSVDSHITEGSFSFRVGN